MKQNTQQCAWTYTLCILASLLVLNGAFPNYILDAHQFKNLFQTPNLDREQLLVETHPEWKVPYGFYLYRKRALQELNGYWKEPAAAGAIVKGVSKIALNIKMEKLFLLDSTTCRISVEWANKIPKENEPAIDPSEEIVVKLYGPGYPARLVFNLGINRVNPGEIHNRVHRLEIIMTLPNVYLKNGFLEFKRTIAEQETVFLIGEIRIEPISLHPASEWLHNGDFRQPPIRHAQVLQNTVPWWLGSHVDMQLYHTYSNVVKLSKEPHLSMTTFVSLMPAIYLLRVYWSYSPISQGEYQEMQVRVDGRPQLTMNLNYEEHRLRLSSPELQTNVEHRRYHMITSDVFVSVMNPPIGTVDNRLSRHNVSILTTSSNVRDSHFYIIKVSLRPKVPGIKEEVEDPRDWNENMNMKESVQDREEGLSVHTMLSMGGGVGQPSIIHEIDQQNDKGRSPSQRYLRMTSPKSLDERQHDSESASGSSRQTPHQTRSQLTSGGQHGNLDLTSTSDRQPLHKTSSYPKGDLDSASGSSGLPHPSHTTSRDPFGDLDSASVSSGLPHPPHKTSSDPKGDLDSASGSSGELPHQTKTQLTSRDPFGNLDSASRSSEQFPHQTRTHTTSTSSDEHDFESSHGSRKSSTSSSRRHSSSSSTSGSYILESPIFHRRLSFDLSSHRRNTLEEPIFHRRGSLDSSSHHNKPPLPTDSEVPSRPLSPLSGESSSEPISVSYSNLQDDLEPPKTPPHHSPSPRTASPTFPYGIKDPSLLMEAEKDLDSGEWPDSEKPFAPAHGHLKEKGDKDEESEKGPINEPFTYDDLILRHSPSLSKMGPLEEPITMSVYHPLAPGVVHMKPSEKPNPYTALLKENEGLAAHTNTVEGPYDEDEKKEKGDREDVRKEDEYNFPGDEAEPSPGDIMTIPSLSLATGDEIERQPEQKHSSRQGGDKIVFQESHYRTIYGPIPFPGNKNPGKIDYLERDTPLRPVSKSNFNLHKQSISSTSSGKSSTSHLAITEKESKQDPSSSHGSTSADSRFPLSEAPPHVHHEGGKPLPSPLVVLPEIWSNKLKSLAEPLTSSSAKSGHPTSDKETEQSGESVKRTPVLTTTGHTLDPIIESQGASIHPIGGIDQRQYSGSLKSKKKSKKQQKESEKQRGPTSEPGSEIDLSESPWLHESDHERDN